MTYIPSDFHRRYLTAFALAALPVAVLAETASSQLDEIVVTASRYDADQPGAEYLDGEVSTGGRIGLFGKMDSYDAPFSVVRYNEELLDNQQVQSVADIADIDAGVQTSFGYGNFSEQFQIRGFTLYGDDVSYGGLYGVVPRQIVLTDIAESIEVLKGASAFANGVAPGSSGIGGSINIEPKYAEEEQTEVGLEYRNNTYVSANVDTARRFGSDDQLGARFSAVYGQGGTAIEDESRVNGSAYLGLDYETDSSHTFFNAGYQRTDVDEGRSVVYMDAGLTEVPDAPDSNTNYKVDWTYFEANNFFGILRHEQTLSDKLIVYGALGANKTDEFGVYSAPTVTSSDGSATMDRLDVAYAAQALTGQAGVEGQFETAGIMHSVNLGYSGLVREYGYSYAFGVSTGNTNIYDPVDVDTIEAGAPWAGADMDNPELNQKTVTHGVALSDSMDLLDGMFNVVAGLRYQFVSVDDGTDLNEGDAVSPVVGLTYHPIDSVSVYSNYVEALEDGELAPAGANNEGKNIGLKRSRQIEVGAKYESESLGASIAVYQINQPTAFTDSDGDFGYNGQQRNRGIEANLYGDLTDSLHLLSNAAINDPVLTETDGGTNEGNTVVGVPLYSVTIGADYDLTAQWSMSGRLIHTGKQYADNANTMELDAWTRLDIGTSYEFAMNGLPVTVSADVKNVTNESYWSSVTSAFKTYLSQGDPLTAVVSASVQF